MVLKYRIELHNLNSSESMFDIQLKLGFHELMWGCMILSLMLEAIGLEIMRSGNKLAGFSVMSAGAASFFLSRYAFLSSYTKDTEKEARWG